MDNSKTEKLYFRHILEGLIHNINTPLNLILGLSQQLQKQHPEIENIKKILNAGLQIDDVLQASYHSFLTNMRGEPEVFDLGSWLDNEIKYLNNDLQVKHRCLFTFQNPSQAMIVKDSPLKLGFYLESLIYILLERTTIQPLKIGINLNPGSHCSNLIISVEQSDELGIPETESIIEDIQSGFETLKSKDQKSQPDRRISCLQSEDEHHFIVEISG